MPGDRERLARLLSGRDEPSVLEKEAGFETVWARVERSDRGRRRWLVAAGAVAVAAAALLMAWPRHDPSGSDVFAARGANDGGQAAFTCFSEQRPTSTCAPGDQLAAELRAPPSKPYLALFALRPDGATVWYLPRSGDLMADVSSQRSGGPWKDAFLLAADAPLGRYRIVSIFAQRPLGRDEIKQAVGSDLRGGNGVTVLVRELDLRAR